MLNKILSIKIKSPLSLRGLFPFCHSRESGNPSSLSLRARRRSNFNGFSLIELMVAAAILAIALLGIFQAYSVGFMGMADARDRTVATNYLREMIEDFKNMDFNKVKDEAITLIPGTKFHRGAIVLDLEKKDNIVTLKKVITQVRWIDRKGEIKIEEASTLLYNKPNTSEVSGAAGIILYASPYYAIIPASEVALFAEIKDNNGNTITDWEGDISFSFVIPTPNDDYNPVGYINNALRTKDDTDTIIVHTTNGKANITFYSFAVGPDESVDGIEKIQASADLGGPEDVTDTVNIRVTTGAVGIILEPATEEDRILAAGGTANINLTVVKADYSTPIAYDKPITLSAVGPGTLSTTTISTVPTDGTPFALTSTGTPGVVEVTASAPDLDMGYTEVTFTGEPESIIVSSKKRSIYPGDETLITVTIVDINNKPVSFGAIGDSKTITLSVSPDYGVFDDNSDPNDDSNPIDLTFEGEDYKTCFFKASIDSPPEDVTIAASGGGLNSGSTTIEILSLLIAHHIYVRPPFPSIIELDIPGSHSGITAIMKSEEGDVVFGKSIIFEIIEGEGSFSSDSPNPSIELIGGEVEAILHPFNVYVTIKTIINIYSPDLDYDVSGPPGNPGNPVEVEVIFHQESEPDEINLVANPQYIYIGGDTCTITATIVDKVGEIEVPVNCTGNITFSIVDGGGIGELIGSNPVALIDTSQATIILSSKDTAGNVVVKAEANITAPYTDLILYSLLKVVEVKEITLNLVPDSLAYWENNKIVSFNIEVNGPTLNLSNMTIEWDYSPSKLKKIEIKSPYNADDYNPIIDTGNATSPHIEDNINANLLPGESIIRLTFSTNMEGKPLTVILTTDFGSYENTDTIELVSN